MADSNTMAQHRPPFQHHQTAPNGFTAPFPQSALQNGLNFPSPTQHSPQPSFAQPPSSKRPRLSPGAQSPYVSPSVSSAQLSHVGSPVHMLPMSSAPPVPTLPGLMGPPSRPVDKTTDIRTLEDPLAGTGVNIDDEERNLTAAPFPSYSQPAPGSSFQSQNASFSTISNTGSFETLSPSGHHDPTYGTGSAPQTTALGHSDAEQLTPAEDQRRKEVEDNWRAGRQTQHPLWNAFLQGDPLERRLNERSYEHGIKSPKEGLFYASKSDNRPPPRTKVEGLDGAVQIIDKGQTIISTVSGDVLSDIMKVISLATKERVTGLLDLSGRLAQERRDHSTGRVPKEWDSIAAAAGAPVPESGSAGSPAAPASLKRTNSEGATELATASLPPAAHRVGEFFRKISQADRAAEEARLTKRSRRIVSANPEVARSGSISATGVTDPAGTLAPDSDKRPTKKDRKLAESKFTEAQQHRFANETARLATGSLVGGFHFGGTKKKTYAWMSGGTTTPKPTASPVQTPAKINTAVNGGASATNTIRGSAVARGRQFGQWDESRDPGIRVRDVLLVLESDGKAPRSL